MKIFKIILINLLVSTFVILSLLFGNTDNEYFSYALGVIFGIWAVVIYKTFIIIKNPNQAKKVYDERQLLSRGKCYEISFFTLGGTLLLDGFIRMMFNFHWSNYIVGVISAIFISVSVFSALAIKKDAYEGINSNRSQLIIVLLVMGLFNLVIAVMSIINGEFIEGNMVTSYFLSLLAGVMSLVIAGFTMYKKFKEGQEHEES
ncbi:hypothetical protein [Acholeplasma hippikon]|uniref:Uncharacterized protein n=1 Tax=Acholeplasma hippikon TaxID=264636 RepID=A0A449BIS0_9MOLU|nr:hypothetical protein [Acholeplasma hippikon]VEU82217.1 Uncharacterised protein [Acholeplasma hippikon]